MNYLVKLILLGVLLICPIMAHAEKGDVLVKSGVLNQGTVEHAKIKVSRLLSELEKIEKIIEKQNKVYDDMKGKEKELAIPIKKITVETTALEYEIQSQRVKLARRMRTVFPYKRSRIINYILGESRDREVSFFRDIQLLKIITRKDARLIKEYKNKIELLEKKNKNIGLPGKA